MAKKQRGRPKGSTNRKRAKKKYGNFFGSYFRSKKLIGNKKRKKR